MKKKLLFVSSFALATLFVVGQFGFAEKSDDVGMNGNDMGQMMNMMNSPEGQEMLNACSNFMESYDESNID